jgi:hypothetical protein
MRRQRLGFGGGATGSFGGGTDKGTNVDVTGDNGSNKGLLGDCACEGCGDSAPWVNTRARAASGLVGLDLQLRSSSSGRMLPPTWSPGASSFSSSSSMLLLRPSRLVRRERRNTDWVGEGMNRYVGKSHESIVPCSRSEGCLRRSRRCAKGGRSPAGNHQPPAGEKTKTVGAYEVWFQRGKKISLRS